MTRKAVTRPPPGPVPWVECLKGTEPFLRFRADWWERLDRVLAEIVLLGLEGTADPSSRSAPPAADAEDERELLDAVFEEYPHGTRAFSRLMSRYWARVWAVSQAILLNDQDAEEAVQDTFLKVHRYLLSYRFESKFTTWLYQVARRAALSRLASRTRRRRLLDEVLSDPVLMQQWRPWRARERAETSSPDLRAALARLDVEDRIVLVMHELEGYGYDEIGEALEMSAGAVRMRALRARNRLRKRLNR